MAGTWTTEYLYGTESSSASDRLSRGVTNLLRPTMEFRQDGVYVFRCGRTELTGRWEIHRESVKLTLDPPTAQKSLKEGEAVDDFEASPQLVWEEAQKIRRIEAGKDANTLNVKPSSDEPTQDQKNHQVVLHRLLSGV